MYSWCLALGGFAYDYASIYQYLLAGLSSMFLIMTSTGNFDILGITLRSAFGVGLVTQSLAYICLCLWIWAFWGSTQSKTSYVLSIIFLALTALSNVHVIPVVIIIYFVTFCYDFFFRREVRKNLLKFYIIPGILAIGLTCFWLLPMLSVYSFMPSQSLGLTDGIGAQNVWDIIHTWWPTGLSFLLALVVVIFSPKEGSPTLFEFSCPYSCHYLFPIRLAVAELSIPQLSIFVFYLLHKSCGYSLCL
jgi:hypothetical protein